MPKSNPYRPRQKSEATTANAQWVAELFGLTPRTISTMARNGEIPAFRPRERAHWKFDKEKILEHKRKMESTPTLP